MVMEAKLISFSPAPFATIRAFWEHEKHYRDWREIFDQAIREHDRTFDFVLQLLKENWCPITEFPVFYWTFRVPRSLHAQLRNHRHWSTFSQSHQLYEPSDFADKQDYFQIPQTSLGQKAIEIRAMANAQKAYKTLRKSGILPSLARGVLPMHINLGLSACTNLRTLFNTVVMRRCHILQGTYWNPLLELMRKEMVDKVDPRCGEFFDLQPCDISDKCLSDIEQQLRYYGKDPHSVCPRWMEMERTHGRNNCCGKGCVGCLKHAVRNQTKVVRRNNT